MGNAKWNLLFPIVGGVALLSGMLTYAFAIEGNEKGTGVDIILLAISIVLLCSFLVCAFVSVRSYARRVLNSFSIRLAKAIEIHERETMIRSADIRENLDQLRDIHSTEYRNLASSVPDHSDVQNILGKIAVLERRMIAGIESNALLNADQIGKKCSDLERRFDKNYSRVIDEISDFKIKFTDISRELDALTARRESSSIARFKSLNLAQDRAFEEFNGLKAVLAEARIESTNFAASTTSTLRNLMNSLRDLERRLTELEAHIDERLDASSALAAETVENETRKWARKLTREIIRLEEGVRQAEESVDVASQKTLTDLRLLSERLAASDETSASVLPQILRGVESHSESINYLRSICEHSMPRALELLENTNSKYLGSQDGPVPLNAESSMASEDQIQELTSEVAVVSDSVRTILRLSDTSKNEIKALHRHVDRASVDTVRQVEAAIQLLDRVDSSEQRYPESGGFAMNPDSLLLLSDLILRHRPKRILELGSGTSTIWTGTFARAVGAKVVSLEHLDRYRELTGQMIADFDLTEVVDLRLAPLREVDVDGTTAQWYDEQALRGIDDIDLLVVDGPPESSGPAPRYPAFPILRERLTGGALIVVDDFHREQEAQMVETWQKNHPSLTVTSWSAGRTGVLRFSTQ
ncbi:O-methyltransferase [Brevibacterium sp. CT2-23B]|uniref:O-methyltransferase n=1 Tax=Brevibacterium sp. CT2-23B TaxID=2729630 RepID=UPI001557DFB8|nr:class I SAM-dependent methyltransferase [Brevibacterium sp. CT2-23B]